MAADSPFFNLSLLLALRRTLTELDPSLAPSLREIVCPAGVSSRRLALLPGSFNPLTNAHLALADAALATGRCDRLSYLLASRTVNKERVEGASLADRLVCLIEFVKEHPPEGVVLVNRGLYAEQAELVHESLPSVDELWFVVGHDKIVQIFDPRYYRDREAVLDRLFALASFLVAPRDGEGPEALATLLAQPENRLYAAKVLPLALSEQYRRQSSTALRDAAHSEGVLVGVPPIVEQFVAETGVYRPPLRASDGELVDRYVWREKLIELLEAQGMTSLSPSAFAAMVGAVTRLDATGRAWRERLERGEIVALLHALGVLP
jgi:nicotinamide-nucleotide adenylyltransferase